MLFRRETTRLFRFFPLFSQKPAAPPNLEERGFIRVSTSLIRL
nr:MAG TPA: hypothetical protein [Caudoviricetes sp.]